MNKKMNVLKVGLALGIAVMVTGCAGVNTLTNKQVNNKNTGIIYGATAISTTTVNEACLAINNKDYRCTEKDNYYVLAVRSKLGFSDGSVGAIALVRKDLPNIEKLNYQGNVGEKGTPYVKVRVSLGQLAEVLEIVSFNDDGKCYWSGMPRIGGVVCPAFNWDYRKDNQAAIVY